MFRVSSENCLVSIWYFVESSVCLHDINYICSQPVYYVKIILIAAYEVYLQRRKLKWKEFVNPRILWLISSSCIFSIFLHTIASFRRHVERKGSLKQMQKCALPKQYVRIRIVTNESEVSVRFTKPNGCQSTAQLLFKLHNHAKWAWLPFLPVRQGSYYWLIVLESFLAWVCILYDFIRLHNIAKPSASIYRILVSAC